MIQGRRLQLGFLFPLYANLTVVYRKYISHFIFGVMGVIGA